MAVRAGVVAIFKGIEVARASGVTFGRPKQGIDDRFIRTYALWKSGQITATEAMSQTGMKKPTFYRRVKEYEQQLSKV
ncbi:DNA recombinase [Paenibacillus sp. Dod16]|uniref:DNA recombinase n=1 Tax=Paenibacillus sp. Dod16 TaxID=3416392 RepID=UPI003CEDEE8B